MGAISPSKMPKGTRKSRRDDTDFDQYAEGGSVSSSKNEEEQPKFNVSAVGGGGKSGAGIGGGGRLTLSKSLDKNTDIQAYLEGGGFKPKGSSFMTGPSGAGIGIVKRFKQGGGVKSKVNASGNYTKPGMRKSMFESIKSRAVQGTAAGQWSARKAQLLAKQYKAKGGGYRG